MIENEVKIGIFKIMRINGKAKNGITKALEETIESLIKSDNKINELIFIIGYY